MKSPEEWTDKTKARLFIVACMVFVVLFVTGMGVLAWAIMELST